jgi:hypothetical protein
MKKVGSRGSFHDAQGHDREASFALNHDEQRSSEHADYQRGDDERMSP